MNKRRLIAILKPVAVALATYGLLSLAFEMGRRKGSREAYYEVDSTRYYHYGEEERLTGSHMITISRQTH